MSWVSFSRADPVIFLHTKCQWAYWSSDSEYGWVLHPFGARAGTRDGIVEFSRNFGKARITSISVLFPDRFFARACIHEIQLWPHFNILNFEIILALCWFLQASFLGRQRVKKRTNAGAEVTSHNRMSRKSPPMVQMLLNGTVSVLEARLLQRNGLASQAHIKEREHPLRGL